MRDKFLPFALPDIGEEEIAEVVDSMRSGWLTTGPKTKAFEHDFADYIGGGVAAMAVSSATAGLHLALEACGIRAGDEVITSVYTFTSTAEVIRYLGADPVFADIDEHTLNISPESIEKAITPKTKAIMPVHVGGLPCDMDAILAIAKKHGLKVVEDAAHAFPVRYKGRMIGALDSDAAVYSFYATKTITTGEGGMVVTKNKDMVKRIKTMRLHGIDRDAYDRYTSEKPAWYYEIVAPGYKYNMSDIMASMGIHQLKKAERMKARRREIAMRYTEALQRLPLTLPYLPAEDEDNAWHLYPVHIRKDAPIMRDEFIKQMSFSAKIGCSVHFIPLHLQPYYRDKYGLTPQMFPCATEAFESEVSLPIYPKMTDEDVEYVIEQIRRILGA
ncbi:DegT/DnrJ/EryC1/StrS family aminotransferase [uncultured Cloacibacillus sp.]|uniref:DegT/DnrJ/EryC1/StrS family aminotransferase n=1 Tax=uncultured Cloacibacillus sp. TaxID=889794 RepID=UPI0025F172DA|nr:DegT/DnrJ/EryC1/StrS family aminotransferase [uncultured Cloacibacillus sp.]